MRKQNLLRVVALATAMTMGLACLSGCGKSATKEEKKEESKKTETENTLVYGSGDYTAINPALYEHGEINSLIFAGLVAHDENNEIVPALADSWDYDEDDCEWTFKLKEGLTFQDGEPVTSKDVKFTLESIIDPKNNSEIVSNYQDIEEIECEDDTTVDIKLKKENVAFLDYMTIGILPEHLLAEKDLATDEFNQKPIGAGPYKLTDWDEGQSITLERFDDYYAGTPKIEKVIFKIVEDSDARLLQLQSGDIDMAQLTPKDAKAYKENNKDGKVYNMKTADYRAIAYNFSGSELFKKYPELSNILSYGINREAIVKGTLLGEGQVAYSPIQKNKFNDDSIEKFDYNPDKMKELLEKDGWKTNALGWYEKDGTELSFTINAMADDQLRVDMANMCAEMLKAQGVRVQAEAKKELDWAGQDACIIGWGSPFDADDHTYKIFSSDAGDNYTGYANKKVDAALEKARTTSDEKERKDAYSEFLNVMTDNMPYTFIAYIDADYAMNGKVKGITENTLLGHHGVGIFYNIADWEIEQ
ncbi:MAG: ABC transporter substrate-binding protein [Lachnospiraceae bacterium]|nr:ABC transporter substrate-binding protein [Lachnospiraceae bacterium]